MEARRLRIGSRFSTRPRRLVPLALALAKFTALSLLACPSFAGQASVQQRESPNSDRLGLSCAQILAMKSTDWVAHFNDKFVGKDKDADLSPTDKTLRAIAAYGRCYDQRTTRLAEQARKNVGNDLLAPSIQFRNFDQATQAFAEKALVSAEPPADAIRGAYAGLYAKQFRYKFYQDHQKKSFTPVPPTAEESEQLGEAKNYFGELLDDLPPQKMKDLHAAFSRIFDGTVSDVDRLAVYRFAIFCLVPPSDTPFAPPPF